MRAAPPAIALAALTLAAGWTAPVAPGPPPVSAAAGEPGGLYHHLLAAMAEGLGAPPEEARLDGAAVPVAVALEALRAWSADWPGPGAAEDAGAYPPDHDVGHGTRTGTTPCNQAVSVFAYRFRLAGDLRRGFASWDLVGPRGQPSACGWYHGPPSQPWVLGKGSATVEPDAAWGACVRRDLGTGGWQEAPELCHWSTAPEPCCGPFRTATVVGAVGRNNLDFCVFGGCFVVDRLDGGPCNLASAGCVNERGVALVALSRTDAPVATVPDTCLPVSVGLLRPLPRVLEGCPVQSGP